MKKRKHKKNRPKEPEINGLSLRHVAQIVRRKTTTQVRDTPKNKIPRKRKHKGDFFVNNRNDLSVIYQVTKNMDRDYKFTLGENIKNESIYFISSEGLNALNVSS